MQLEDDEEDNESMLSSIVGDSEEEKKEQVRGKKKRISKQAGKTLRLYKDGRRVRIDAEENIVRKVPKRII